MNNTKITLLGVVISITILGCTTMAPLIEMPKRPSLRSKFVTINIPQMANEPHVDEIAQMEQHIIPAGSSVVISVPKVESQAELKGEEDFSTSGHFHVAEQQVEKELINHKFRIISREKFEAKFRKQRGVIRADGLQELTDITEVIRAAEEGGLQSDYLLQINAFTQNDISEYEINLAGYPEFEKLMDFFPDAVSGLKNIQYQVCSEYTATLNAKLIHVPTGEIVWIGNHITSTRALLENQLSFKIGVENVISNVTEIELFVERQNTETTRKARKEGDPIHYPEWQITSKVSEPIVVKGYCRIGESQVSSDLARDALSKAVASALMQSIKVAGF